MQASQRRKNKCWLGLGRMNRRSLLGKDGEKDIADRVRKGTEVGRHVA